MTSVLALDASKYVGHAYFKSAQALPVCRTWVAHGLWDSDNYAPYFLAFEKWLIDMLTVLQPDVLAFESPIVIGRRDGRGSDENNIRRLIGIVSVAELVAARRNLRCYEIHNQTAKSFVGVINRKPPDMTVAQYKSQMVTAMTNRNFAVADSHQADACALALVVFDMLEGA